MWRSVISWYTQQSQRLTECQFSASVPSPGHLQGWPYRRKVHRITLWSAAQQWFWNIAHHGKGTLAWPLPLHSHHCRWPRNRAEARDALSPYPSPHVQWMCGAAMCAGVWKTSFWSVHSTASTEQEKGIDSKENYPFNEHINWSPLWGECLAGQLHSLHMLAALCSPLALRDDYARYKHSQTLYQHGSFLVLLKLGFQWEVSQERQHFLYCMSLATLARSWLMWEGRQGVKEHAPTSTKHGKQLSEVVS